MTTIPWSHFHIYLVRSIQMDNFPKASRPSKLKRRRRNQQPSSSTNNISNNSNSNPLVQFSAGAVPAVQSKNNPKQILNAASEHANVAMEYEPEKSIPILASRDVSFVLKKLPLASTVLGLSNNDNSSSSGCGTSTQDPWNNSKAVIAQIDHFITLASNQNYGKIVHKHDDDGEYVQGGNNTNGRVHHSILGTVNLLHRQHSNQIAHGALAFPKIDALDNVNVHDNDDDFDSYQRGDGVLVASDCLSLPVVFGPQCHTEYIKIVSEYGATIRTQYEINENHDSLAIGKLNFGEIRAIVESKWLDPPIVMSGDGYDDEKLVGVVRYKVRLFHSDVYKIHNEKTSFDSGKGLFGWISDRSRLEDDPFVIAQMQE